MADLASRRAHAPLVPLKILTSAPAPEIHTSFDDSLLQVSSPTAAPNQSYTLDAPKKSPVGKISSSRPPTRPSSPKRSGSQTRPFHARQMSARSLSQRKQSDSSSTSLPLDSRLTAPSYAAERSLRPKKSRTSLFTSLFSRPNVQRARGHGGEAASDLDVKATVQRTLSRHGSKRLGPQSSTSETESPQHPQYSPTTNQISSTQRLNSEQPPRDFVPQEPPPGPWSPPPLFQAYPQAIKYSTLEAPPSSQANASKSKISLGSISETQERPKSRPGTSRFVRPASRRTDGSESRDFAALSQDGTKKIYILVTAGYLLQYSGEGQFDRLPEKSLKLTKDSAAYASDLIPGKHWVLQVIQSPKADPFQQVGQQKSWVHRWSPSSRRRDVMGLLLIFDSPPDMDSWMTCMRREIEHLGGELHTSRPTTAGRAKKADQEALMRRTIPIPKSPSLSVPSPLKSSPSTPTLLSDSGRTSGATGIGTLSDFSIDWTPGKATNHMRNLSDVHKLSLQTPGSDRSGTDPVSTEMSPNAPFSTASSLPFSSPPLSEGEADDADFEYLFPAPGNGKITPQSLAPSPATFVSATSQLTTPSTAATPASAASEKRLSTYQMAEQSKAARAGAGESLITPQRAKGTSSAAMESIDETQAFFTQRQPSFSTVEDSSLSQSTPQRLSIPSEGAKSVAAPLTASPGSESSSFEQAASYFPPRSSSRLSTFGPLPTDGANTNASSKRSSYRTPTNPSPQGSLSAPSPNAFALASVPEDGSRSESRLSSRRTSTLIHSTSPIPLQAGKASPAPSFSASFRDDDSSRSSRRTSVFTNNGPLPLYASSNASTSPATSGYTSWNSSQRTSVRMSIIPAQARLATIGAQSNSSLDAKSDANTPTALRRPTSISVSNDRIAFLASKKGAQAVASSPSQPPGGTQQAGGFQEREQSQSVTVPVVRPPSVLSRRSLKGRGSSSIGLPPPQPPPSVPLPCLPPKSAESSPVGV